MLSSNSVSSVFCKAVVTKSPFQLHLLSDVFVSTMELIECKGETKFHSVTNMNCKQEGEVLDLDEQVDSNASSNSLMVSKVKQWCNGAPIPILFTPKKLLEQFVWNCFFHNQFMLVF